MAGREQGDGRTQRVAGQSDPGSAFFLDQRDGRFHLEDRLQVECSNRPCGFFPEKSQPHALHSMPQIRRKTPV